MNHVVKAKMLRESDEPIHYNCAQSLFVAFSDVLGVSDERAFAMGANYGGGMMHGGTCGVVSAGLMILSLAGIPQEKAMALLQDFSRDHGTTACTELLMKAAQERRSIVMGWSSTWQSGWTPSFPPKAPSSP